MRYVRGVTIGKVIFMTRIESVKGELRSGIVIADTYCGQREELSQMRTRPALFGKSDYPQYEKRREGAAGEKGVNAGGANHNV